MIEFKKLTYRNFLSVGNNGITIEFKDGHRYLVQGKNGSGKSCLIDALMFSLYGKAFRKINKPQLINSINEKNCETIIEFDTRGSSYKILRGVKPNVLRVWKDNKELEEHSNVLDFQRYITSQILRMNESSFRQLVVLGSKSYKPFMVLDAAERREVIEDLLDIGVYQSMLSILKKKNSGIERDLEILCERVMGLENSIETSLEYLEKIKGDGKENEISKKKSQIERLQADLKSKKAELKGIRDSNPEEILSSINADISKLTTEIDKLKTAYTRMTHDVKRHSKELKFFEQNTICSTCHQDITDDFRNKQIADHARQLDSIQSKVEKCDDLIKERKSNKTDLEQTIVDLRDELSSMKILMLDIENIESSIEDKENELIDIKEKSDASVDFVQEKIESLQNEKSECDNEITELKIKLRSYDYIFSLLKDDGIKMQIIQTYLPLINKLIRKYLDIMEFNLDFRFDESFKETVRSRGRDEFSYGNFSEGEKLRIDLCLLFTWRELSRIKASAATNLLVMDEIGESSLDEEGFRSFMNILNQEKDNQCAIIISHSPEKIESTVDSVYEFKKVGNFTELTIRESDQVDHSAVIV